MRDVLEEHRYPPFDVEIGLAATPFESASPHQEAPVDAMTCSGPIGVDTVTSTAPSQGNKGALLSGVPCVERPTSKSMLWRVPPPVNTAPDRTGGSPTCGLPRDDGTV